MRKIVITIEGGYVCSYLLEKLEDELAELLQTYGWNGHIEDEITGNTTRFPLSEESE